MRFLPIFLIAAAFGGCHCRGSAYTSSKPAAADDAAVPAVATETGSATLEQAAWASVTVFYAVPDGPDSAYLINYSGIALDETRVLTVIVEDLPKGARAPTIWFGDRNKPGSMWDAKTVPEKEVQLSELGLKILTCERLLPGIATFAVKSNLELGEEVFVIGTYAEGVEAMVSRGNVAKLGGVTGEEDELFLIDASMSRSSAGAGVYDEGRSLIGIVVSPFVNRNLGIIYADVGVVVRIEAVAKALREKGIRFMTDAATP
jgi:hypothetical protein